MKIYYLLLFFSFQVSAQPFTDAEISRWQDEAKRITIIRDNWGIPHIYGKTDADCVFGLMYAQCEDDFKRIEMNYVEKLGRLSELNGDKDLYKDLLNRLVLDSVKAVADFKNSPPWLQKLMNAFSDGINYYLSKNPSVKPALLKRFKPWYSLLWTDGSIGAINTGGLNENDLKNFYSGDRAVAENQLDFPDENITGSNGFAIAPSRTGSGHAMLYINPHVSFYFRTEVQVKSEEGLNAYGAVTWGQFFVYQGFNEHCGWMHTSSNSDVADLYAEQVEKKGNSLFYHYDNRLLPVKEKEITIRYLMQDSLHTKKFKTYSTHHGPAMAIRDGKWITVRANNRSLNGLIQSWNRTKSRSFEEFKKNMELLANCSNNTVYADAEGNIAYWHGDFIPKRDTTFDWSKPVDGTITATEWKGLHKLDEIVHVYNPVSGWIQNCNSTPFTVSGSSSPRRQDYPYYMAPDGENFRALTAARLLADSKALSIEKLIAIGYDSYLSAFEQLIPALKRGFKKAVTQGDSTYLKLSEPLALLQNWDLHAGENSIATTLAIEWGQRILPAINKVQDGSARMDQVVRTMKFAETASPGELLEPLQLAVAYLSNKYGDWKIPWGRINRYQRLTGAINEIFDDNKPSLPMGMASSLWGCLPSFVSNYFPGTQKRYGYNGNSFICAVEFGEKIRAKSLITGGESGNPLSKHFNDQALMYTHGEFKELLFYKEDVLKHAEKTYHPGGE
jgi:acyl-homoserine-lactone acylase